MTDLDEAVAALRRCVEAKPPPGVSYDEDENSRRKRHAAALLAKLEQLKVSCEVLRADREQLGRLVAAVREANDSIELGGIALRHRSIVSVSAPGWQAVLDAAGVK